MSFPIDVSEASNLEASEMLPEGVSLTLEKREGRQRHIEASLVLPYVPEQVWQVLTDYGRLAEFIPNLAKSERLAHADDRVLIEQVGVQDALFLKFSARVVLEMQEYFPHRLGFEMVEGDFKAFDGAWQLHCVGEHKASQAPMTKLIYQVQVHPKRTMPVIAVERRLRKDLPCNLIAIRDRLDALYNSDAS